MRLPTLCWVVSMFLIVAIVSAMPRSAYAQHRGLPHDQNPVPEETQPTPAQRALAKKANQQRQEELKRDTDKLFKLATELKEYVDKTNADVLSVEVLKKAEEIEKLARGVKDRMRGPR